MFRDVTLGAALFKAAVENSYDLIALISQAGTFLYVNPAFHRVLGFRHEDLVDRNALERVHPDDLSAVERELSNAFATGRGELHAYRYRAADGGWRWVESSGATIEFEEDSPPALVVISRDVTERKKAEEAAFQTQFNLQSIFDVIPEGILIHEDERVVNANPALLEMMGYTLEEVKGRIFWEMIVPESHTAIRTSIHTSPTSSVSPSNSFEVELIRSDGSPLLVEIIGKPYVHEGRQARLVVIRDIRERRQSECALRASEERFRQVAENINEVFWMSNAAATEILYVSPAYERIWGRSCASLYENPQTFLESIHQDDRVRVLDSLEHQSVEGGYDVEYRVVQPDGTVRWVWDRSFPIRDEDGHVYRVTGIAQDITERRHAEAVRAQLAQQLEHQHRRLNDVLLNVPGIVWENEVDPVTHHQKSVFVSGYVEVMLGYSPNEWLDTPDFWFSTLHPDDRDSTTQAVSAMLASKEYDTIQYRMLAKDGSAVWVETHCVVVRNEQDEVICVRGVTMDITERWQALEEQQRLIALLEAATDFVGWADAAGAIQYINPAGRRMLSIEPDEPLREMYIVDYLCDGNKDKILNEALPEAAEHGFWSGEVTLTNRHGHNLPFSMVVTCHKDAAGQIQFYSTIARDITELKAAEAALLHAKDELEKRVQERTQELAESNRALQEQVVERQMAMGALQEAVVAHEQARHEADLANQAKSEFLSRMSHELRTPLNAILGFGQLLQMTDLPPKRRESVRHIIKAGHHLLGLINDVLDISRIEAGNLSLSLEPVHVESVVQEVLDLVHPLAQGGRIELKINAESMAECQVVADRQRLKQVLLNLVSNAVKYNRPDGYVEVFATERANEGILRISVRDTGNGLSDKDLARLFTPFERLNAAKSTIEGTGIGLVLSRRLMEAMEGRIGVESTLGQGSTFWVELPLAANLVLNPLEHLGDEAASLGTSRDASLPRKTVLYIEDNLPNLELIEMLFEDRGDIHLLTAMQASTGLDIAFEHLPNLILLDLHLPDLSGTEVLKRLRANPATADIPVVIVSADATPGQIQRLLDSGATNYLTKPLDIKQFMQVVVQSLE